MTSVFLSYDREDATKARSIAFALEKAGHSVWWDRHIKGGAQYSKEIEAALKAAEAVVVLWSAQAIDSPWIRDEAAAGRDSGRLVPVMIDETEAPLGFRQYQGIDLSNWKGRGRNAGLAQLLEALESIGGQDPASLPSKRDTPKPSRHIPVRVIAAILIGLALAAAAFFLLRKPGSANTQTVLIAAADSSQMAMKTAQQLLVNLGNLHSAKSGDLRLVGPSEDAASNDADLVFETSAGNADASANLVLMAGNDRSLLWSRKFEQAPGKQADLEQQMAFTAGRVLGCASEGLSADGGRLDQPTLKLYLNGCAQLAEIDFSDPVPVISMLVAVLDQAPRFQAAWAKLLTAEAGAMATDISIGVEDAKSVRRLRGLIERARRIDPEMAEIALAESVLTPPNDYASQLALLDRALARAPDHVGLLGARSHALESVGRMRSAVFDASNAAAIDPLSPDTWGNYVAVLLYAGKLDAARDEMKKAERIWPGTATLQDMHYRYHLRFGDPVVALRMLRSKGEGPSNELFALARINPSTENVDRMITFMLNRLRSGERGPTGPSGLGRLLQGLGQFDRNDQLFEIVSGWPRSRDIGVTAHFMFRPALRNFVRNPRFMRIAKRAGLIDYWRTSGNWPDFCFEPDQPYDCKAETAKVGSGKGGA